MYRLTIALLLFATVSQALPTNATNRMATESYVTNKVAVGVASAVAQAGTNTTAALALYYPRNNPSNYITLAQVPAQTQQVYVAIAGTAGTVTGAQSNIIASALQSETDPIWGSVSNSVRAGAALGATAVQPAALSAYLALSGGTMSGSIKYQAPYYDIYYGLLGIHKFSGLDGTDSYYTTPDAETGNYIIASRAWAYPRNNPSNYITLAQVPAETDSIALGRLTTHTNRTDNPHVVTASQVGALTALETTNAIAASMSGNLIVQLTTNKTTAYTFAPTNATYLGQCAETALPAAGTVSVPIGTNGNYALAWGCTNSTFTSIEGTYINGELFCSENEAGDITAKVEIYRRDIITDVMSEWGDGGATFTVPANASPQVVSFSVWVPSVDTNSFRIWARVKRVGGTATSTRLLIVGSGAGTPTHFSMIVPASVPIAIHNSDPAAHPSIRASIAPMSYTPISTPAGVNAFTATVTTARSLYDFTASAVNTFTNNLTALTLNGTTNYQWNVGINYTVTNALSTTWDSRIEWVGLASSTPDLTVTGRYVFAFETSDGVTIKGRQVYPTIYQWSNLLKGAFTEDPTLSQRNVYFGSCSTFISSAGTNYLYFVPLQARLQKVIVSARTDSYANAILLGSKDVSIGAAGFSTSFNIITKKTGIGGLSNVFYFDPFILDSRINNGSGRLLGLGASFSSIGVTFSTGADNIYINGIISKELNELEIKHYNAGGTL